MTDRNPSLVVTSDDTLPGVVERLRDAANGGRTVDLVVPIDSALLLTAREFRTLKEVIDADRVAVLLRTSDPLRLQLAERLGIPARALPRPRVSAVPALAPSPVAISPSPSPVDSDALAARDQDWPGATAVAAPVFRPAPESHWPGQSGLAGAASDDESPGELEADVAPEQAPGNPPRRWLPVAAALAALVVAAVLAIRFVAPQAVVTIIPRSELVTGSIVFDVTTDGQPIDDDAAFALTPQQRQIEVVWEGTAPVTGVRVEPDGTASSAIELRNASAEPLVVDAGTTVSTETSVEFTVTEAVTVPAADPGTGEPGAATGNVQAAQAGSGGNVGAGELGGRLANGVYYSNRMAPAAGGSDQEFPVVAPGDLDSLIAAATDATPALAAAAIAAEGSGETILPSAVTVSGRRDEFDHQSGEDAAELALQSTMTVDVMTYDGNAATQEYEQALAAHLNDEAAEGFAVTAADIDFEEPRVIEESDRGVRLEVQAQAGATAILDAAEREALAAALAGASAEDAAALLARSPEIAEYTVDYHPAWLPEQMPNNAGRIQIEIAG